MNIKSYELIRNEFRSSIVSVTKVLEKYLSAIDESGGFSEVAKAKTAHYESATELIAAIQKTENISVTVSELTLGADAENDTMLALKLEGLLDIYVAVRRTVEEYLTATDSMIVKSKNVFPVLAVKQSADIALRKIKILLNDKI